MELSITPLWFCKMIYLLVLYADKNLGALIRKQYLTHESILKNDVV